MSFSPAPKMPPRPAKAPKHVKRVNAKRRQSEFARCYHSPERVEWVKSQPCAWCVLRGRIRMCGPTENAHTAKDGMGLKAGYETIAPLGKYHHDRYDNHEHPFITLASRLAVKYLAKGCQARWQLWLADNSTKGEPQCRD